MEYSEIVGTIALLIATPGSWYTYKAYVQSKLAQKEVSELKFELSNYNQVTSTIQSGGDISAGGDIINGIKK